MISANPIQAPSPASFAAAPVNFRRVALSKEPAIFTDSRD